MGGQKYTGPQRPPFDYSGLLKGSLRIAWRHKYLWFFGLFTFGFGTSGGRGNFNFSGGDFSETGTGGADLPSDAAAEIGEWVSANLGLILAIAAALAILMIVFWLWSAICRGAVVGTVSDIRDGSPGGFRAAFARGRRSFGWLVLLDLLFFLLGLGLVIILIAVIAGIVFFGVFIAGFIDGTVAIILLVMLGLALLGLLFTGLGCVVCVTGWFAVAFIVDMVIKYATIAIILEGARPMQALKRAWRVMADNLARNLLLYLLSAGLNIAVGLATLVIVGISSIPAIFAWIITGTNGWPAAGIALSIIATAVPVAVMIVLLAAGNTYFAAYWTIVFRRFTGREPQMPAY